MEKTKAVDFSISKPFLIIIRRHHFFTIRKPLFRFILDTSVFDGFYRFIFDTSDKRIIPWSVRQKKIRGSRNKAFMRSRAKASGDDIRKWWVSLEPLEIGEYERAEIQPNAKDSVIHKF